MSDESLSDLIVLTPGKDEAAALEGLFTRHTALGIRRFQYSIDRHEDRDPGCRLRSGDYLRPFARQYRHALMLFDHEGCGAEQVPAERIEATVEQQLTASGWAGRAACIVIEPELENWLWSDSPHVDEVLGWSGRTPGLRQWLCQEKYLDRGAAKPARPKEATEAAMRVVRKHRTSVLYRQLAERVSLDQCRDRAFLKLKRVLREWFPGPMREPVEMPRTEEPR
jgi:hypothetical protein